MLQEIIEDYPEEEFLKADGFDDAIIGVASDFTEPRLIYSVGKIINILMDQGMTSTDAIEHFNFNIGGGYVGEKTPIWCYDSLWFNCEWEIQQSDA
tara:strand:+ start:3376 stop:3663 length:288 start_codon:yes stop_codon:yes gene_type:complete